MRDWKTKHFFLSLFTASLLRFTCFICMFFVYSFFRFGMVQKIWRFLTHFLKTVKINKLARVEEDISLSDLIRSLTCLRIDIAKHLSSCNKCLVEFFKYVYTSSFFRTEQSFRKNKKSHHTLYIFELGKRANLLNQWSITSILNSRDLTSLFMFPWLLTCSTCFQFSFFFFFIIWLRSHSILRAYLSQNGFSAINQTTKETTFFIYSSSVGMMHI